MVKSLSMKKSRRISIGSFGLLGAVTGAILGHFLYSGEPVCIGIILCFIYPLLPHLMLGILLGGLCGVAVGIVQNSRAYKGLKNGTSELEENKAIRGIGMLVGSIISALVATSLLVSFGFYDPISSYEYVVQILVAALVAALVGAIVGAVGGTLFGFVGKRIATGLFGPKKASAGEIVGAVFGGFAP